MSLKAGVLKEGFLKMMPASGEMSSSGGGVGSSVAEDLEG